MRKITAIIKVKTSLPELAAECLNLFGEGARTEFENDLYAFAYNNTPVQNNYIRVPCAEHIATALQWMQDTGVTSDHGEVVRVEWHGQDRVVTGTDEDGNPIIEEKLFQVSTQDVTDEQGNITGQRPVYLGRIS